MGEKRIEELAKKMAEVRGIPLDAAISTITIATRIGLDIKEAIIAIGNMLSGGIVLLQESHEECIEQSEEERWIHNRQVWPIVWDMRKKSQVISNKPQFMVRKIIR